MVENHRKEMRMNSESMPHTPVQTEPDTARLTALLTESSASPADCSDGELAGVDFSKSDVLVGTVRCDEQFDYCMSSLTYYVPAKTVEAAALPVAAIALYEEGLSRKAGIKRYGEVIDTRVVKRGDIPVPLSRPNPEETYYLFTVSSWQYLETPIALQGTVRGRPMLTNRFLLTHCRRSYQLTAIRSPERYRLCALLCALEGEADGDKPLFRRVGERHLLTVSEGRLHLLDGAGSCLYACPLKALHTHPAEVLERVAEGLGM